MKSQLWPVVSQLLLLDGKTLADICKTLAKSKRQLLADIQAVNAAFQVDVITTCDDHLRFTKTAFEVLYKDNRNQHQLIDVLSAIKTRRSYLFIRLLLTPESFDLKTLQEETSVSKNTILSDIKHLKATLQAEKCQLHYSHTTGYVLVGDELMIRSLLIKTIAQLVATTVGKVILFSYHLLDFDEYFMLKNRLEKLEKKLNIYYSDEMIQRLPYTLLAVIERCRHGEHEIIFPPAMSYLYDTKEFLEITTLFWDYPFLRRVDLMYLTIQVLSSNVIESRFTTDNIVELQPLIDQFIASLEVRLAIRFRNKRKLKQLLIQHIQPALFRNYIGAHVINPLAKQFTQNYSALYAIVEMELTRFDFLMQHALNREEVSFIAMIILGFMVDNSEHQSDQPFSAIVICQSGTSLSQLLLNELEELFPNVAFKHVLSQRQSEIILPKVDFIFSTIALSASQPTFLVKNFMTSDEKSLLVEEFQRVIAQDHQKVTRELLAQLAEIIPAEKEEEAVARLEDYFEQKERRGEPQALSPLHSLQQIEFIDESLDLLAASKRLFAKILARGSINKAYVAKSLDNLTKYEESMILTPNVLLPHASYEDGVYQMDVQIGILKQPLRAVAHDRYRIIIALAPDANNKHVNWLVKMNEHLIDQFATIVNCDTLEEVYQRLRGDANEV